MTLLGGYTTAAKFYFTPKRRKFELSSLSRKWRQRRGVARWNGGSGGIEHHRKKCVITGDPHDINHALFAECGHCACIGGIADALITMQLITERVEHLFVSRHFLRTSSVSDGLDDVGRESTLQGELIVRVPLVVLGPVARGDENGELAQTRWQHAVESQVVTHRACAIHHLGTAQQRHERTGDAGFSRRGEFRDRLLLRLRLLALGNRRQAILRANSHRPSCEAKGQSNSAARHRTSP